MTASLLRHITTAALHSIRVGPAKMFGTAVQSQHFGLVIDIDGVLIRGRRAVDHASDALARLDRMQIPYVFLTNSGGLTECDKAATLAETLKYPIDPKRMILSHTPMKSSIQQHPKRRFLIVGRGDLKKLADSYDIKNYVLLSDYAPSHPDLFPFRSYPKTSNPYLDPIDSIIVFNTPVEWGESTQILVDLLASTGVPGNLADYQQVDIHFSNSDLLWSTAFKLPRFGQGAFRECVELLYEKMTSRKLQSILYGKPYPITYRYVERHFEKEHGLHIDELHAIGDNPESGQWPILLYPSIYKGQSLQTITTSTNA